MTIPGWLTQERLPGCAVSPKAGSHVESGTTSRECLTVLLSRQTSGIYLSKLKSDTDIRVPEGGQGPKMTVFVGGRTRQGLFQS